MEKLHSGWLTKSPPLSESKFFKPASCFSVLLFNQNNLISINILKRHVSYKNSERQKWRRRYFVLYVPPGSSFFSETSCSALLDYYSNDKMTHKKGTINLSKCRSVHQKFVAFKNFTVKLHHKLLINQ